MEDEQKLQLEEKIVNLLNRTSPRPNIIEAMEVLENIKNAFQYHLDDNMKSFRKINSPTKPNPRRMANRTYPIIRSGDMDKSDYHLKISPHSY